MSNEKKHQEIPGLYGSLELEPDILEEFPIGIIIIDDQLKIIEINGKAREISGLKYSETLGTSLENTFSRETMDHLKTLFQNKSNQEKQGDPQWNGLLHSTQGKIIWCQIKYQWIEKKQLLLLIEDISDQILNDLAREESIQQLQQWFETMPTGIIFFDLDGKIQRANPAALTFLGRTSSEIRGKNLNSSLFDAQYANGEKLDPHENLITMFIGSKVKDQRLVLKIFNPLIEDYKYLQISFVKEYIQGTRTPSRVISSITDISQRMKAELNLRQERKLFISGPVVVLKLSLDSCLSIKYVSRNIKNNFGYSPEEILQNTSGFLSYIHPADQVYLLNKLKHWTITRDISTHSQQVRIIDLYGKWHKVEVYSNIEIHNESDNTEILCYLIDITEKVETYQQLQLALESTGLGTWEWDFHSKTLQINPQFNDILGLPHENTTISEEYWISLIHPDDSQKVLARMEEQIFTKGITDIIYRCRHSSGEWRWMHSRGKVQIQDKQNKPIKVSGIQEDITEQHKQEEKKHRRNQLQSIHVEIMKKMLKVKSNNLTEELQKIFDSYNPFLGLTESLILNLDERFQTSEILVHWTENRSKTILEDLIHNTLNSKDLTNLFNRSSDYLVLEYLDHNILVFPLIFDDRFHILVFTSEIDKKLWLADQLAFLTLMTASIADTMVRISFEQDLIKAKHTAEQASQAKSTFLASMSHEIRTPINGIIGLLYLLEDTPLNKQQKEYLQNLKESSNILRILIDDILDLSKIEAHGIVLNPQGIFLKNLLNECLNPLQVMAEQQNLYLNLDMDENLPETVETDPQRLTQIINNLVGNAIKFTEHGGIEIKISIDSGTAIRNREQVTLQFSIKDSGIGIPEDKIDSLFKKFSQIDASDSRKYGGTGLGLAISRELCELLGGSISVKNNPEGGATFFFTISAKITEYKEEEKPLILRNHAQPGSGYKILLAEDNEVNALVARGILEKQGYQIERTRNGLETLSFLGNQHCDLILMDIQMPEMDGLEATREIRMGKTGAENREIPIIALSASVIPEEQQKYRDSGVDACLGKPIQLDLLIQSLSRFLPPKPQEKHQPPQKGNSIDNQKPNQSYHSNVFKNISEKREIWDQEEFRQRFLQDDELINRVIEVFKKENPRTLEAIEQSRKDENLIEMNKQAHALKGSSLNLSAKALSQTALELEKAAQQKDLDRIDKLIEKLKKEWVRLLEIM